MENDIVIAINKHQTVRSSEILMLKADINYTHILLENGNSILSSRTLGIFERRLFNQPFFRPNRAIIINLDYMIEFEKSASKIKMSNNEIIPLSRRRTKQFLTRI
ncbi:LytR/AlgR family response regulator transcription factor [Emticicia sp. 17c]|uniref:LytR/AlgR family response regulator transcription factor n=1 Tax=Emticicia sp. 17c TaxID=3127704 RepID=UPI00301B784F